MSKRRLLALYDLKAYPISFDFFIFLAAAEIRRIKLGLDETAIAIIHGDRNAGPIYDRHVDRHSRQWRLTNILLQAVALFPFVTLSTYIDNPFDLQRIIASHNEVFPDPTVDTEGIPSFYRYFIDGYSTLSNPPTIKASPSTLGFVRDWIGRDVGDRRIVTITLRLMNYEPLRNSNLGAWARFAQRLDKRQYYPIVVPDTDAAFSSTVPDFEGIKHMPAAAFDIGLRLALYESAHLNMLTSNGAIALMALDPAIRYLYLKVIVEKELASSASHLRHLGISVGGQLPNATPYQRIVWRDDDLEVIEDAFVAMDRMIAAHGSDDAFAKNVS